MTKIKPSIEPWDPLPIRNRRQEVVNNRLRAGHSQLTHGYLLEDHHSPPPHCPYCLNAALTIEHLLINCEQLQERRGFTPQNQNQPLELKDVFHFRNYESLIQFVTDLGLLSRI